MADVEGRVVEPDVGFDADAAFSESGIERDSAPVIIVGVDAFLYEREQMVSIADRGTGKRRDIQEQFHESGQLDRCRGHCHGCWTKSPEENMKDLKWLRRRRLPKTQRLSRLSWRRRKGESGSGSGR